MTFGITTYGRAEYLPYLLEQSKRIGGEWIFVNDGCERTKKIMGKRAIHKAHGGVGGYWNTVNVLFSAMKKTKSDLFIWMPDDMIFVDNFMDQVLELWDSIHAPKIALSLHRDSRKSCWNGIPAKDYSPRVDQVGFVDGACLCTRDFLVNIPNQGNYFKKFASSGVGRYLTGLFQGRLFAVQKSLLIHREGLSQMHSEIRKRIPLRSL